MKNLNKETRRDALKYFEKTLRDLNVDENQIIKKVAEFSDILYQN